MCVAILGSVRLWRVGVLPILWERLFAPGARTVSLRAVFPGVFLKERDIILIALGVVGVTFREFQRQPPMFINVLFGGRICEAFVSVVFGHDWHAFRDAV